MEDKHRKGICDDIFAETEENKWQVTHEKENT